MNGVEFVAVLIALALAIGSALIVRDTLRGRGRWGIPLQPAHCPECGRPAVGLRWPRNIRQWLWGGWTCKECGLECDKWGRSVVRKN
jgi:hypothetical protein